MKTAVDTSVLVAALASWHESHEAAARTLDRALGGSVVIPADALLEAYSVLTRLPAPHRLSPGDALRVLEESLGGRSAVALTGSETWSLVRKAAAGGTSGGSVSDARIAAEALKGGAGRIATLNARHFERLVPDGLEVIVP